jgi:hypothetical protein
MVIRKLQKTGHRSHYSCAPSKRESHDAETIDSFRVHTHKRPCIHKDQQISRLQKLIQM